MWPFPSSSNEKRLYLDFAAATPVHAAALRAMEEAEPFFANPSAIHRDGLAAQELLESARKKVAAVFEVPAHTMCFTSGGTEGNNLAIFGAARARVFAHPEKKVHLVVSSIEHTSILEPIAHMSDMGVSVTLVAPDTEGRITAAAVRAVLTPDTALVSVGWANGEVGTVQSLHTIAQCIRAYEKEHGSSIVFHTDAGQAPLYLPTMIAGLGVDVMTLDSGKLYGPRGVGALYVRDEKRLAPVLYGGGQENGLRPGTENVVLAAGFAAALVESARARKEESRRLAALRAHFIDALKIAVPDAVLNGSRDSLVPHIVHISIPDIDAEYVALALDAAGISISTKSSCEEGERVSRVVSAMVEEGEMWRAQNTLRISMGSGTTQADVARCVIEIQQVVERYRSFAK